jgi:hypothetical protein
MRVDLAVLLPLGREEVVQDDENHGDDLDHRTDCDRVTELAILGV